MGFLTAPNIKKLNFKNHVKSPYLSNCLTDFDKIWHGDADAY